METGGKKFILLAILDEERKFDPAGERKDVREKLMRWRVSLQAA